MNLKVGDRLKNLRRLLAERELDGILISQTENRRYLSGFDGSAGFLLITPQAAVLATDFRYLEQAEAQAPDYRIFRITNDLSDWLPRLAAELNPGRLGFETGDVTFALYREIADILKKKPRLELIPQDGLIETLRAIKEPEEIELITKAVEITDRAFAHIEEIAHTGMAELELAWEIEKFQRENGSQMIPFEIIVASGPNAALPHAKPSERQIGAGEPVVIDMGASVSGYGSDLTRTLCLDTTDATFKKVYDTVLGAQLAAIALIEAGMTGEGADSMARTVITEAGYGEAFGHSLGHGVGLVTHELPRLGPGSKDILESGMVFSIEPGIYIPGWGGVRIEDLVVMEEGKIRVLSKAKK